MKAKDEMQYLYRLHAFSPALMEKVAEFSTRGNPAR